MTDTVPSLRGALEAVDAEVRHHLRSDEVDHAIIRKPVVAMVRAALAALTETCPDCCGSGYGGHPDSGITCYRCGGSGSIAAEILERLTKERDEARRLVGLARRLAGAVQRFRNLPGLERNKLRETPEYHDLCERWRAFQEADSAAMQEAER